MRFLSFNHARYARLSMLGALCVLAAFGGWGCPTPVSYGPAISGTEFAYVTNSADNTVTAYAVNANAGTLKSIGTVNAGKHPFKIASVSRGASKNYVYVLNQDDNTVSQFRVNTNGTLAPLAPATVAVGKTPSDIASSADGRKYQGFTYSNNTPDDSREFRIYVTAIGDNSMYVFGINTDGTLLKQNVLNSLNTPIAVNTSGPDYTVYDNSGNRYAPHDLDNEVVVLNRDANTLSQYTFVPLAQGGLKRDLSAFTVPTGQSPSAVAGTSSTVAVCNGQAHTVTFYLQDPTRNMRINPMFSSMYDTSSNPTSVATAGLDKINPGTGTGGETSQSAEYIYVSTSSGAIYQFDGSGMPLSYYLADVSNVLYPPVQLPAQPMFLKAYRGHLYVVKQSENIVTSYALQAKTDTLGIGDAAGNGRLDTTTAQSSAAGHSPTAITFLNTSLNAGAVQTTIH